MMSLPTSPPPSVHRFAAAVCACLALVVSPASAQSTPSAPLLGDEFIVTMSTAVGDQGELFNVQVGMHLDLFPEDPDAGWNTVLALDVVREGELAERLVIPGTEGFETESDAAILFEGGQLWVLWMSRADDDELSHLDLISFTPDDSSWSDLIEVSGDPLPVKGSPSLAVTRETVSLAAAESDEGSGLPTEETVRTVVHALWWEEPVAGDIGVYYTPIILSDGEFLGWNPVVELDAAFLGATGAHSSTSFAQGLLYAASLDGGVDRRSVVVGLPEADSGRLHSLVVRLLPDSLAALAENARSHIVGVGLVLTGGGGFGPGDLAGVAEKARSHIVGVGRVPLHRGVREYVGARVAERILQADLSSGPDQTFWDQLARDVWNEVIDSGASLLGNQLRAQDLPCGLLHLGSDGLVPGGSEAAESLHQVEFCIASQRPLPATADAAEHRLVVSEDGSKAVVLWKDGGTIRYRRSNDSGWGPVMSLPDGGLELADAARILRSQIRLR